MIAPTAPSPPDRPFLRTEPVALFVSPAPVPYAEATRAMDHMAADIRTGGGKEALWLLEHPPLYTGGTTARDEDLLNPASLPVFRSPRGGQYTYHGPGQRVAYAMLNLAHRKPDVRAYVHTLESVIVDTLSRFGVRGEVREGRVGVWVRRGPPGARREDKIAAIGVRVRRWVTLHGLALNVEPDLAHFAGIVPCGISDPDFGVTSLVDLGLPVTMDEVDDALLRSFTAHFGPVDPPQTES